MLFNTLLSRVSYATILIGLVLLLLLAMISFSCAAVVSQSSSETELKQSSDIFNDAGIPQPENPNLPPISDVQSRLDIMENIIHLIKTQSENQQEEIRQLKDEIQHIKSVIELSTDRLSQILMPMDSKILEQTKKINEMNVTSTTPPPALTTSTVSVPNLKTTTTPEAENPLNISSPSDPKNCSTEHNNLILNCENMQINDIKDFFQRTNVTTNNLFTLIKLTLFEGDGGWIPADILGNNTKTEQLVIEYDYRPDRIDLLRVDVNAFRSTKNYTNSLKLNNFNSSQLDLGFLSGFHQLSYLILTNVHHIQNSLPTLPLLPKLIFLELNNVTGLNDSTITFPTLSTGGLKTFKFRFSGMHTDASVNRMLDWIPISSAKTLETLSFDYMRITEIPSQIPLFKALNYLDLDRNSITTIKNGALRFSVPVLKLNLARNNITSIEPAAFQGNFRDARVDLSRNDLTRFDESVFRPMLEQMVSGRGSIVYYGNRIDCSTVNICHLTWAILNNKFRSKVWAQCSNGTDFDQLGEAGFNHCPITKKP